jgi:hypothetical protein
MASMNGIQVLNVLVDVMKREAQRNSAAEHAAEYLGAALRNLEAGDADNAGWQVTLAIYSLLNSCDPLIAERVRLTLNW